MAKVYFPSLKHQHENLADRLVKVLQESLWLLSVDGDSDNILESGHF